MNQNGSEAPNQSVKKRRVSRLAVFFIVVGLIAAAFGAGALLVYLKLRDAEAAWKEERSGLEADVAARTAEAASTRSRELLWRLELGMSSVYIDMAEKNFGLAHDEIAGLSALLGSGLADFDDDTKAKLAPLEPLIKEISAGIDALDPAAKGKAREARDLLEGIIGRN